MWAHSHTIVVWIYLLSSLFILILMSRQVVSIHSVSLTRSYQLWECLWSSSKYTTAEASCFSSLSTCSNLWNIKMYVQNAVFCWSFKVKIYQQNTMLVDAFMDMSFNSLNFLEFCLKTKTVFMILFTYELHHRMKAAAVSSTSQITAM